MAKIKFVYFDLGGVVCPVSNKRRIAREFSKKSKKSFQQILDILNKWWCSGEYSDFGQIIKDFDVGELDIQEFYEDICRYLELEIDFFDFVRIWKGMFGIDERFVELIVKLKNEIIGTGIISDLSLLHYEEIASLLRLEYYFDVKLFSFMQKRLKKECAGATFLKSVSLAKGIMFSQKIGGENIAFVDDREDNIAIARSCGIVHTFHYRQNFDFFVKFLKKGGIKL